MILVTTASQLDGYKVIATKGEVQGTTLGNMLRHAEQLGANAILRADCSNAGPEEALFHGSAVVVEPHPKGERSHVQPMIPLY